VSWHLGVIGTGGWAEVHLAAFSASPYVDRVTLVGRNERARRQLAQSFPIVKQTRADPAALWDDASVQAVSIVLPHFLHGPTALAALAAGKHVICEKPAAIELSQFDQMEAASVRHDRRLLVVMNQLYNPVFRAARRAVEQDMIGEPFLSVENAYSTAAANYRRLHYWRNTREQAGGGVLLDGGFHMVYRHLDTLADCGTAQWVQASTAQLNADPAGARIETKGEDFVSATVGYAHGLRIALSHAWTVPVPPVRQRQSFLAGREATLEFTDEQHQPLVIRRGEQTEPVDVPPGPRSGRETTHTCLLDYIASLAEERPPAQGDLKLARTTLATILAIYRSGETGQVEFIG